MVLCLSRFHLPAPRVPRCVWRAVPSGCPLPSLAGKPFHAVCPFRELGPVALLVVPTCPLRVCPRHPLPPPLGGVGCAPRAVPALGAGRGVPRGSCPSACPPLVPCSVWRAWGGGGGAAPVPPYLAWGCPPPTCCGRGCVGVGAQHCPGCMPRGWGGRPRGGGRLPLLSGASGVRRCPFSDRPSSGAGSRGSATRVSRVRSVRAWGPSTGPTACALAGRRCSLWGWRSGVPGGGAFHHCEGRLRSGAVPPPTARSLGGLLGSATQVLWARVCGCGGPTLSPWPACPVGAACRGGVRGSSLGGPACHRCEGRPVSGAVPPPAARPPERAARVPRLVCPGCRRCGRGDPAPAPQRAPLRVGVARCGVGGRASPGGVPSTIVRGV